MTATTTVHLTRDARHLGGGVVAPHDPQAIGDPTPEVPTPAGSLPDQPTNHHPIPDVGASAGQVLAPHPTNVPSKPNRVASGGGVSVEPDPAVVLATSRLAAPGGFDELGILAASYQDAQDVRIRIENRFRAGAIPPNLAKTILDEQRQVEKMIGTEMRRRFRRCAPDIHTWVKDTVGVGEHLMARLLGAIGHPVIATPHHWEGEGTNRVLVADPPFVRNVAKLWAYCGHGDPARRKRKGMTADEAFTLGNPQAKKLVHLLAESAMKCVGSTPDQTVTDNQGTSVRRRSPYRDTYDVARARYSDREDWTLGHQHNAALRLVGKEILRDLWRAAQPANVLATPEECAPDGLPDQNRGTP